MKMITISILLMLFTIPLALAITKDGNCLSTETCMFSIYQPDDTHAASCNYFNYSVCYPANITINLTKGNCSGNQYFVLSQYQINDSHVSDSEGYFNYSLCSSVPCTITNKTCKRENHMVSLYQPSDTHLGSYEYYTYRLCCGDIKKGALAGPKEPEPEIIEEKEVIEVAKKIAPPVLFLIGFFILLIIYRRRRKKKDDENKNRDKNIQESGID